MFITSSLITVSVAMNNVPTESLAPTTIGLDTNKNIVIKISLFNLSQFMVSKWLVNNVKNKTNKINNNTRIK